MVARAVVDERGLPTGVVSTIRDMSRHKARQRALQQVAALDSLTGADTRRAFLEKLEEEMLRVRHGARACLLLIDIDHFTAVNDCYGHGAGDRVLAGFGGFGSGWCWARVCQYVEILVGAGSLK